MNVLVTGASKGIGKAIAEELADSGEVFVTGRNETALKLFGNKYCICDIYKNPEILCDFIRNNKIDVLINNAGEYIYGEIEKMSDEDITRIYTTNLLAPTKLIVSAVPHMKKQNWGRIINIGSISGVMGEANASAYSMTKASLIGLTKAAALELAQNNITVNIINPGWVDTDLIDNDDLHKDFSREEIIETIPQRRYVLPSEIAHACGFLISDSARTITGQCINICAGLSLGF